MTAEPCILEFDGRVYRLDPHAGTLASVKNPEWMEPGAGSPVGRLTALISDYGVVPQMREVNGRSR